MKYLPLVVFLLGGVALAFAAKYVTTYGLRSRSVRTTVAVVYYFVTGIAAYLAVVWWQAVILDKGGLWAIQHYFPVPGLWFTIVVLVMQVVASRLLWMIMNRNAERFWRQYAKH